MNDAARPDPASGADQPALRVLVCGSVDDGKSTLVGRMLYDTNAFPEDELRALHVDSPRWGTQGGVLDLALAADGLCAKREQCITIDVAYRHFEMKDRRFLLIDAPSHEQDTSHMVSGASHADVALVLVDAVKGFSTQTFRHALVASLFGVESMALVVNKMDRVSFSRDRFDLLEREFKALPLGRVGRSARAIPVVALTGDNVVHRSSALSWYGGPTLIGLLEAAPARLVRRRGEAFRLPVRWVNRPGPGFRGYCGRIASGSMTTGMAISIQPSGRLSRIRRIIGARGDVEGATAGESVTFTLDDEVDVRRGDLVSPANALAEVAQRFRCTIVWMHEEPLRLGASYLVKKGTCEASAKIVSVEQRILPTPGQPSEGQRLLANEIASCQVVFDRRVPFDPFEGDLLTGGFILVEPTSFDTVGVGLFRSSLSEVDNVAAQALTVDRASRAALKGQRPVVLWFTGLSGAGKSTIANLVESRLLIDGRHSYLLDGDNVRRGLCSDLGFTDADRRENIRRAGEVVRLMIDAGLIVLAAFISPFRIERTAVRSLFSEGEFIEIHVQASLEEAERRDVKGLYRKARLGHLRNFTGIDSPYEVPVEPDIRIDTEAMSAQEGAEVIIQFLRRRGILDSL